MKTLVTMALFVVNAPSFSQGKFFRTFQDYTNWTMDYYKNPQPQFLIDGFEYGVQSSEIKKSGTRNLTLRFFASALTNDTTHQNEFYRKYSKTDNEDFIYGYAMTLLLIHTDYSLEKLRQFINLPQTAKYKKEFEKLMSDRYSDIWTDPIVYPQQLDMLWADFFATGSERSVVKIISKLSDINSKDTNATMVAGSAKWSLTSNAIRHDKVMEVCKKQMESSDPKMKKMLEEIVTTATKQKGKK